MIAEGSGIGNRYCYGPVRNSLTLSATTASASTPHANMLSCDVEASRVAGPCRVHSDLDIGDLISMPVDVFHRRGGALGPVQCL